MIYRWKVTVREVTAEACEPGSTVGRETEEVDAPTAADAKLMVEVLSHAGAARVVCKIECLGETVQEGGLGLTEAQLALLAEAVGEP